MLTAVMLLSFTGCSSAGSITTFTAAVEEMPTNFDPQIATAQRDLLVINNIFDGLYEILDGEVVENVAENCNISADGKRVLEDVDIPFETEYPLSITLYIFL